MRAKEARLRRERRTAAHRATRNREERQMWQERLAIALTPGFGSAERIRRVADALARKGLEERRRRSPSAARIGDGRQRHGATHSCTLLTAD